MTITDLRRAACRYRIRVVGVPEHFILHPEDLPGVLESCKSGMLYDGETYHIMGMTFSTSKDTPQNEVWFVGSEAKASAL